MIETPNGPQWVQMPTMPTGGNAVIPGSQGSANNRTPDYSRVNLPKHLQRDGARDQDGEDMDYYRYEKKLDAWVEEFPEGRRTGLAVKALNGLIGDLWDDCEKVGTDGLQGENGHVVLKDRIYRSLFYNQAHRQGELFQEYITPDGRKRGEKMHRFLDDMGDKRKRMEGAVGAAPGSVVNNKLHGLHVLARSQIGREDQRFLRLARRDDTNDSNGILNTLKEVSYLPVRVY